MLQPSDTLAADGRVRNLPLLSTAQTRIPFTAFRGNAFLLEVTEPRKMRYVRMFLMLKTQSLVEAAYILPELGLPRRESSYGLHQLCYIKVVY